MTKKIEQSGSAKTTNEKIIQGLTLLMRKYELEKDRGRAINYRKAVLSLKSYGQPILNSKQILKIPHIGKSIASKVDDFFANGEKFMDVESTYGPEKMAAIEEMSQIWGVGDILAGQLYDKGYKSVEELKNKPGGIAELTSLPRIGLKYYYDLKQKMPRKEVSEIQRIVAKAVKELFTEKMLCLAVGSFRRGRETCGDADIMITRVGVGAKKQRLITGILQKVVRHLQSTGFIIERLGNDNIAKTGSETFMGICKLPGENTVPRRIDVKVFPATQFGFAVMYFTGCADLNQQMRACSLLNGFTMSEATIARMPVKNGKVPEGKLTQKLEKLCADQEAESIISERDIFRAFNMEYVQPCDREQDKINPNWFES